MGRARTEEPADDLQELLRGDRLFDIFVAAVDVERLRPVLSPLVHPGCDEHRRSPTVGGSFELLADLEPMLLRNHRLDQDHVGVQAMEGLDTRYAVGRDLDAVPGADERLAETFDTTRLVGAGQYCIIRH